MSAFKDIVDKDIKTVFLDFEVFGEMHLVEQKHLLVIIDNNENIEREKRMRFREDGLFNKQILFYVAAEDLGFFPEVGGTLEFDKEIYVVEDAVDEMGIYSITLNAVRS
jgi:hypothetical protein